MKSKLQKSQKSTPINFDLLYKDLTKGDNTTEEGYTTAEIAELMGCGIDKARKVVQHAMEAGKCRTSRRFVKTITGYSQRYVTYVFEEGVDR